MRRTHKTLNPPHTPNPNAAAMLEGQHPRNVSLSPPNGSTEEVYQDTVRKWIEFATGRMFCIPWRTESIPAPTILNSPDLLEKYWGMDRLIAYDISDVDMSRYKSYLKKFYVLNNQYQGKANDLIREFLEKEKAVTHELEVRSIPDVPYDPRFIKFFSGLLDNPEQKRHPFITCAAAYLMKEAELIIEWVKRGHDPSMTRYTTLSDIRDVTMGLASLEGNFRSDHTAAVLLGITKEVAEWLKDAYNDCFVPTDISTYIMGFGFEFLTEKLYEFRRGEHSDDDDDDVASTVEINQLTGSNTGSVNFGKSNQQQCVSPKVPGNNSSLAPGRGSHLRKRKRKRKRMRKGVKEERSRRGLKSAGLMSIVVSIAFLENCDGTHPFYL